MGFSVISSNSVILSYNTLSYPIISSLSKKHAHHLYCTTLASHTRTSSARHTQIRIEFIIIIQIPMAKSTTRPATTRPPKPPAKSKDIAKDKSDLSASPPAKLAGKRGKGKQELQEVHEKIAHDYELKLEGGVYKLRLHQNYELREGSRLYDSIPRLLDLFKQKQERRCLKTHRVIPHSNFPSFEFSLQGEDLATIKCSICQFQFEEQKDFELQLKGESDEDVMTLPCSHLLHRGCFQMLKGDNQWIKCPVCSSIYGMMIGDQSPGTMHTSLNPHIHCDGFPGVGTHVINYSMSSGKRGDVHFSGTHRTAYLPDTPEGREVLALLEEAFRRKLIFTVGRSVTTGRDNTVVWNGIHHKTNLSGGSAYFGFPDDTYFSRVKLELAMKGIYPPVPSSS